ncbi:MAG TPA: pyridoxamine 5'-phosphate oxidase [Pyrinomonadaceae bacterium]|nr:pyridoxamine 5'-phosphate oxidase [Pyrinomonadaceae bacterium]
MTDHQDIRKIIHGSRHDFSSETLAEGAALADPFRQFELWIGEAFEKGLHEPNAMVLSTVAASGRPSSRVVLMRDFDQNGFIFYTNYDSRKAVEIEENPHAALLFYWADLAKQVRIEGTVKKVPAENSDAYFASRPRENQIGALASAQSSVISGREELEEKYSTLGAEFADREIPRPENWGGYILAPVVFEFWQGRQSRLHDRLRYTKTDAEWQIERLAP